MKRICFFFYKLLAMPMGYLLLQVLRPLTRGKLREMIHDKNTHFAVVNDKRIFSQRPVWIHAASGEIEYARSVIRELQALDPDIPILVTYSSPSAKAILQKLKIDAWTALPWDFDFCFESFYQCWNPRMLLISRTDLWPVMADYARRKKIPAFLFSATFADNSSRLRGLTRFLTAFSLEQLQGIFCVTREDQKNLEKLSIQTPTKVLGDTRFDQVFHRLEHAQNIRTELRPASFCFVMGSTWPEDEAVLLAALPELKGVKFILAPHEIDEIHLQKLEMDLKKINISYFKYSSGQIRDWQSHDLLLVDKMGILAELYTWGNVAFVGGSFKKQVHSVMEPLAAGLPVIVGPMHENNREALSYQRKHVKEIPLVLPVNNAHELVLFIRNLLNNPHPDLRQQILSEVRANAGSTARLLEEIKSALYELPDSRS